MHKGADKMYHYDDRQTQKVLEAVFYLPGMIMILIVYGFIYTSFIAVKLAIQEYGLTFMAYMPSILSLVAYPVILYRTRKMFQSQKRLSAVAWMMATASVIIVGLYWHLLHIIP
ncbi:MAG: hypothetical protein IE885_02810 [Campylobacterales bacterium]|nr:hypothetical protein [Campylobacterales bacterium]